MTTLPRQLGGPKQAIEGISGKRPSMSSIPHLRSTVAILQDFAEPESFSVVDIALFLRLCKLDRQTCQVLDLIDGQRTIGEIVSRAASLTKVGKTSQESLEFFLALSSNRVIEF